MKDVHAMAPRVARQGLRHVGIEDIRKPLTVLRGGRAITLTATFGVTVDLPSSRKGSDLSRNAEILAEIVDRTVTQPVQSMEWACSEIAKELLVRHPYAQCSRVRVSATHFLLKGISPDRRSMEDYHLSAEAQAMRVNGGPPSLTRWLAAEAVGMTACPCAMSTARDLLLPDYPLLSDPSMATLPIITHNQRNRTRLTFELHEGVEVEADDMIATIEAAQSSPTYAILKRGDEAKVVLTAHRDPKFVEDVMRDLLSSLPKRFPSLPDAVGVLAETWSEESIHKYDVVASHDTTLGELRQNASA
ncbi:MAG: GTP cyclohydrolase MptA [Thermoplasmata archaeon]|nr:GTP cyclohydrolase MptA [Thermoplasmata archaeon]